MATGSSHGTITGPGIPTGPGGPPVPPYPRPGSGWTAGRIVTLVIGSVLALVALGLLAGGGTLLWANHALRHDGYLTTNAVTYQTSGYALASQQMHLGQGRAASNLVGNVRLQVTATSAGQPVFVAIGPASQVTAYLSGTDYAVVTGTRNGGVISYYGTARPAAAQTAGIWTAEVTGTGTQTLRWTAQPGDWRAVVMNPDGSAGVSVRLTAGVSAPGLSGVATGLIVAGIVIAAGSVVLIVLPARSAARSRRLPRPA